MADREELELIDLDDDIDLPELPHGGPLESCARPRRPWLLFGLAAIVIILATYIIISVIRGGEESVDIDISLPTPTVIAPAGDETAPEISDDVGAPVRVVGDRANATFNPAAAPVEAPRPRPATTAAAPAPKPVAKTPVARPAASAVSGGWSVQVGSYGTRDSALAAQRRLQANHKALFEDRSFVVLAAVLPNGKTTHRLRVVGFKDGSDANGFCRNAKSDGLDCFVTK
ncbi:MAG: SPOR domain-containing protein [Alphaproteobacteria bacterium]|nr:SPOR domain-containing protein [Alphaproteobacteria bacterium]MCL2890105.1 SPOR domain-containing protein [Alphaproteobacteria bacterium]